MAARPTDILRHLRREGLLPPGGEEDGQLLQGFIARRDEAAFEALVRRHGPMVLGVCRRVLGNTADAEDAFQATFLVLARKATSVVPRERVGGWLHGVAYRTALRAKAVNAKRRAKEREAAAMPRPEAPEEVWARLEPLLDAELQGLPDKYRLPVVLCDLQGKTRKEVACQLGWAEGTVASRLARGRGLLAKRLSRHGLGLPGASVAAALSAGAASASVPAALMASTIKAAPAFAAGPAAAGPIAPKVAALAEGVLKAMLLTRLKVAAVALLVVALLAAAGGGLLQRGLADKPAAPPEKADKAPAAEGDAKKKAELKWAKGVAQDFIRARIGGYSTSALALMSQEVKGGAAGVFGGGVGVGGGGVGMGGGAAMGIGGLGIGPLDDPGLFTDDEGDDRPRKLKLRSVSISSEEMAPEQDEIVFKGTLDFGPQGKADFTVRLVKEKESRRWRVNYWFWDLHEKAKKVPKPEEGGAG